MTAAALTLGALVLAASADFFEERLAGLGVTELRSLVRAAIEAPVDPGEIVAAAQNELVNFHWQPVSWRWPSSPAPEPVRRAHAAAVLWLEAFRAERAAEVNAHDLETLGDLKQSLAARHAAGAAGLAEILRIDAEIAARLVERRALRAHRARLRALLNLLVGGAPTTARPPLPRALPPPPAAEPSGEPKSLAEVLAREALADARGRWTLIRSHLVPAAQAHREAMRVQFSAGREPLGALIEAEHEAALAEALEQATLAEVYQAMATLELLVGGGPAWGDRARH